MCYSLGHSSHTVTAPIFWRELICGNLHEPRAISLYSSLVLNGSTTLGIDEDLVALLGRFSPVSGTPIQLYDILLGRRHQIVVLHLYSLHSHSANNSLPPTGQVYVTRRRKMFYCVHHMGWYLTTISTTITTAIPKF
ncbi:hypothetical protein CKAN_01230200 [Cinnamomum micranthum f. kanehirae]|uniref:Uncharacterized protein n=1 Tax=Cinnamomum micranthum f. kanehirae TaxID=337451 RepID=A0A3S3P5L4_9MAGN|nr:hypothetical protein CKAN_01230200 [Cinnamomum micranthum f. kanehirae]